ncbi:MAG: hybrid sensor histidine kinase/response regulator [Robiginitomaculum sp.]|nr:MAG: hybrid sensor histidine kinase/response regulator [Robiginitomaculum sp.]
MEKLIRLDTGQLETSRKKRLPYYLGGLFFSVIAIAASSIAIWYGQTLGRAILTLCVGIAVVALLAMLTIIINYANLGVDEQAEGGGHGLLGDSFEAFNVPSLLMRKGRPIFANAAYMKLAFEVGASNKNDTPPLPDALFSSCEGDIASAIFRLHHITHVSGIGVETVSMKIQGLERNLQITVTPLESGQLWQIEELADDGANTGAPLSEAPIGLFSIHTDGRILQMNEVLKGWLGYQNDELPENISDFIENPESLLESQKTHGRIVRTDTRLKTRKGVNSPTMMSGSWQEVEPGHISASVAVYGHSGLGAAIGGSLLGTRTQSGSTQTQALSQDANTVMVGGIDVLGEAPFGVVHIDSKNLRTAVIRHANAAFTQMTGKAVPDDGAGLTFLSLFTKASNTDKFLDAGVNLVDAPIDLHLVNGDKCPVNIYFSQTGGLGEEGDIVAYMIDISKRKELEDDLLQAQKMQAVGQLAGGVAHDFNNLLTVIRLNTDELLGRHPIGDPSYPELQQINQTVARSASLVKKLLAFSRKQTMRVETLNVTDTLSEASVMIKRMMVETIKLDVVHGRGLPAIQADSTQFDTIMMNLCVNARDAMVEKGKGGTITLSSVLATAEDYQKDGVTMPKEGGFVIINVTDTGTGMDAATQKKIFEPFFTTKEQGKGTGLGLATVYGIVEQMSGHLRVESTLGVGTTFKVYIPMAKAGEDGVIEPATRVKPKIVKPANLAGQGRILFVEDEDPVRAIAAKTLRKRGYTVIEACDGEEAYEMLEEGERFDLMISDVVMPGMDGPTLLKKGREMLGDARIVFISGYAEEEFSDLLADEPDVTFLPKPFTLTQLAEKVKGVIGDAN